MNDYSNSISALLNGPDIPYKQILIHDKHQFNIDPCREKNSFLQIHVRPLNAQQQKRLLEKQLKYYDRWRKNKCLHLTFPISYPCLFKSKKKSPKFDRLKSAVSILFNDETQSPLLISEKNHSSNAHVSHHQCQSCGSLLSQGICSCIVHRLFQLNSLVKINDRNSMHVCLAR